MDIQEKEENEIPFEKIEENEDQLIPNSSASINNIKNYCSKNYPAIVDTTKNETGEKISLNETNTCEQNELVCNFNQINETEIINKIRKKLLFILIVLLFLTLIIRFICVKFK